MSKNNVEQAMTKQWAEYRAIITGGVSELKDADYRRLLSMLPMLGVTRDELASDIQAAIAAAKFEAVLDKGDTNEQLDEVRTAVREYDAETLAIIAARQKGRQPFVELEQRAMRAKSTWQDANLELARIRDATPRLYGVDPQPRKDYLTDVIERLGNASGPLVFR